MKKRGLNFYNNIIGILFILPTVIFLFFTSLYPLIYSFILSFFKWDMAASKEKFFIGFQNYINAFQDKGFLYSLFITIIFVVGTIILEFVLGLFIALLLSREGRTARIGLSVVLIPLVMTPVIAGILWRIMYNPDIGLINYFLSLLNIKKQFWLSNPDLALISVMITDIWKWTPFVIICFVAGIRSLPQSIFEASKVDGANVFQEFKFILLPMLKPIIISTMILRTLDAFKVVDTVYVMTYGGPGIRTRVISLFIYQSGLRYFKIGYTSAISWIFIIFMFIFTLYFIRLRQRQDNIY